MMRIAPCCAEASGRPQIKQKETDVRKLEQRQKQVDYGKNTIGYTRYSTTILKCVAFQGLGKFKFFVLSEHLVCCQIICQQHHL